MPKVPTIEQRVQRKGVSGGGSNVRTTVEDFGGGRQAAQIGNALTNSLKQIDHAVKKEKKRADDSIVQSAMNDFLIEQNRVELEFSQKKGMEAQEIQPAFDDFGGSSDTIKAKLNNNEQRAMFDAFVSKRGVLFDKSVKVHSTKEFSKWEEGELTSGLEASKNDAITNYEDGERLLASMASQKKQITQFADNKGMGEEWKNREIKKHMSETHLGIIKRMSNHDQDISAKGFFDIIKEDLVVKDLLKAEALVEHGSFSGKAQRGVDDVFAQGMSESATYANIRKNNSGKMEDEMIKRAKARFSEVSAIKAEKVELSVSTAYATLAATKGDMSKIPMDVRLSLGNARLVSMEARAKQIKDGVEPERDVPLWNSVLDLQKDDPKTFLKLNPIEYSHQLPPEDIEAWKLMREHLAGKLKSSAKKKKVKGLITYHQLTTDLQEDINVDPDSKDGREFVKQLGALVEEESAKTGASVTNARIRELAAPLSRVTVEKTFGSNIRAFKVTIDDIEKSERARLANDIATFRRINKSRTPVTEADVVELFLIEEKNKAKKAEEAKGIKGLSSEKP